MKNYVKNIFKGFYFGLLLQIAVGPVCLFVIKTAAESGVLVAESGVVAVTIVDLLFVLLAVLGIGSILEKPNVKAFFGYFGMAVLIYFGLGVMLESMGIQILPSIKTREVSEISNVFVTCLVLTASNPLTILFWSGVFATKIKSDGFGKGEMLVFGGGAVLATPVFLGIVSLTVGSIHWSMNEGLIKVLNIAVGTVLLGFGVKMFLQNNFRRQP